MSTSGRQFDDWTADYRLFSKDRVDPGCLFDSIRGELLKEPTPMSPFFQADLVWGWQFIQISAVLPADQQKKPGRAIPIDFTLAPTPIRPKRKAPSEEWTRYRRECRARSLAQQGVERLHG
jgi:hypothetical protein